jgi:cytochrome c556
MFIRRFAVVAGLFACGLLISLTGLSAQAKKEVDLDATMKKVQPAFGALRKSIEAMDAKMAADNVAILKTAFTDTAAFFEARAKHDAHGWATDAQKVADQIAAAAAASKWDEVKASAGGLGKFCQTCHTAYREKAEDGTYRLKAGD